MIVGIQRPWSVHAEVDSFEECCCCVWIPGLCTECVCVWMLSYLQLAYYDSNITGTLKFGAISNLDGIETKQLFVWLPVTGIYVDVPATPYIYFEVGVLTKRLALATFETPPKCSPDSHEGELHLSSLASSINTSF